MTLSDGLLRDGAVVRYPDGGHDVLTEPFDHMAVWATWVLSGIELLGMPRDVRVDPPKRVQSLWGKFTKIKATRRRDA